MSTHQPDTLNDVAVDRHFLDEVRLTVGYRDGDVARLCIDLTGLTAIRFDKGHGRIALEFSDEQRNELINLDDYRHAPSEAVHVITSGFDPADVSTDDVADDAAPAGGELQAS